MGPSLFRTRRSLSAATGLLLVASLIGPVAVQAVTSVSADTAVPAVTTCQTRTYTFGWKWFGESTPRYSQHMKAAACWNVSLGESWGTANPAITWSSFYPYTITNSSWSTNMSGVTTFRISDHLTDGIYYVTLEPRVRVTAGGGWSCSDGGTSEADFQGVHDISGYTCSVYSIP